MKKNRVELPEDLVMEILCKLPVKSLIRFSSICKYWCSCFRNPGFISKHHQNSLENNHLNLLTGHSFKPYLYQLSTQKDESFRAQHDIGSPFTDVYGPSCHGLFFYMIVNSPRLPFGTHQPGRSKSFLHPHSIIPFLYLLTTFLKVLVSGLILKLMTAKSYNLLPSIMMVGSESSCIHSKPPGCKYCCLFNHNLVDGICYWEAIAIDDPHEKFILSFDIVKKKFSTLPYHEYTRSSPTSPSTLLFEFNRSLRLIAYSPPREGTSKVFDFWIMNGGGWSKQSSIVGSVPGFQPPLGLWKNGELLFSRCTSNKLFLFDPSTRMVKNLGIDVCPSTKKLTTYVESLFSIDGSRRSEHDENTKPQPFGDASNRRERKRKFPCKMWIG